MLGIYDRGFDEIEGEEVRYFFGRCVLTLLGMDSIFWLASEAYFNNICPDDLVTRISLFR